MRKFGYMLIALLSLFVLSCKKDKQPDTMDITGEWELVDIQTKSITIKNQIIEKLKSSSNREVTLQELLITYPQISDLFPQLRRASIIITTIQ